MIDQIQSEIRIATASASSFSVLLRSDSASEKCLKWQLAELSGRFRKVGTTQVLFCAVSNNNRKAIKESAKIDGVNAWQMMVKICVPLAKPALATVTLFSIVGHWNNFFDGLLLINNPDKVPLQTYIQSLVVKLSEASNMSSSELIQVMSQRTFNAAKIVASTIPILVIYPFMQKYFVTGLTLGSVKE